MLHSQVQTQDKFDNNINKLISDWDAMEKGQDVVTGLHGEGLGGRGEQRERRRKSKEFQSRIDLFEEILILTYFRTDKKIL